MGLYSFIYLFSIHWHLQVTSFISFKSVDISDKNKKQKSHNGKTSGNSSPYSCLRIEVSILSVFFQCFGVFLLLLFVLHILSGCLVVFSRRNREEYVDLILPEVEVPYLCLKGHFKSNNHIQSHIWKVLCCETVFFFSMKESLNISHFLL